MSRKGIFRARGTGWLGSRFEAVQLKFPRHFVDEVGRDGSPSVGEGIDQGMFAEYVDYARDSASVIIHALDSFRRKDCFAVCSRSAQPLRDIAMSFLQR